MALRLVGVDAPAHQAPKIQEPHIMQGSQTADSTIAASTVSSKPMLQAGASAQESLMSGLDQANQGVVMRSQRQLEVEHQEAQYNLKKSMVEAAAAAQRGDVLSNLAQTAAQYLLQRQQAKEMAEAQKQEMLQRQREAAMKAAEEAAKAQRDKNFTAATMMLRELASEAEGGGFKEKGTLAYTLKAAEALQSFDLDEEDRRTLLNGFYSVRDSYESQTRTRRDEATREMRVSAREREKQQYILTLQPSFAVLKDNPQADTEGAMTQLRNMLGTIYKSEDYTPSEKDDMAAALIREVTPYVASNVQAVTKLNRLQQDITDYKKYESEQVAKFQAGTISRQQLLTNLNTFKQLRGLDGLMSYDPRMDEEYEQFRRNVRETRTEGVEADIRKATDGAVSASDRAINAYAIQLASSMGGIGIEELKRVRGEENLTAAEKTAIIRAEAILKLREQESNILKEETNLIQEAADINSTTLLTALRERKPLDAVSQAALSVLPDEVKAKAIAGLQLSPQEIALIDQALQGRREAANNRLADAKRRLTEVQSNLAQFGFSTNPDELKKYVEEGIKEWQQYQKRWQETSQQFMKRYAEQAQAEAARPQLGVASPFNQAGGDGGSNQPPKKPFVNLPRVDAMGDTYVTGQRVILPLSAEDRFKAAITGSHGDDRGTHQHAGIDIAVPMGTRIVNPIDGEVLDVKYQEDGYGHYVDIVGDDGLLYRYAHIKPGTIKVKKGDRISAGSIFAESGGVGAQAGRSSGAHIHMEIRNPETPYGFKGTVNPVSYLASANVTFSTTPAPRTSGLPQLVAAETGEPVEAVRGVPANAMHAGSGFFIVNNQIFALNPAEPKQQTQTQQGGYVANLASAFPQIPGYKPVATFVSNVQNVINSARPMSNSYAQATIPHGARIKNDPASNHGYATLAEDREFRLAITNVADRLNIPAMWLADVLEFESGFDKKVVNGSGHVGLIQFAPRTLQDLGYTREQIQNMSRGQQVRTAVYKYLSGARTQFRSIHELYVYINGGQAGLDALRANPLANWRDGNHRWRDFHFKKLGRNAGRQYELPGSTRLDRLTNAIHTSYVSGCVVCEGLRKSGSSIVPHEAQSA